VHLGANNPRISYSFNNSTIVCAESMRDLSVIVVLSLTPMLIMLFVSKAYARISLLFRGFSTRNIILLRHADTTYVRPVLEYASTVWNQCLEPPFVKTC